MSGEAVPAEKVTLVPPLSKTISLHETNLAMCGDSHTLLLWTAVQHPLQKMFCNSHLSRCCWECGWSDKDVVKVILEGEWL